MKQRLHQIFSLRSRTSWGVIAHAEDQRGDLGAVLCRALTSLFALTVVFAGSTTPAQAVPSYARQTGQPCSACHTTIPELTAYGRQFKMGGYVDKVDGSPALPVSAVLIGTYTHSRDAQDAPPLAHSTKTNNTTSLDQVTAFYAGRIAPNMGAFMQVTYEPDARATAWDNMDVRYARQATLFGLDGTFGVSVNNSPTVQDVWATTPAWGYPQFHSAVAPQFGLPETILQGAIAQQVLGATVYAMLDNGLYVEAGSYGGLTRHTLTSFGAGGAGFAVSGAVPYTRLAFTHDLGGGTLMVGAMGMVTHLLPNRSAANGSDRYVDLGFDAQYDYVGDNYGLMIKVRDIYEWQRLRATLATGGSTGLHNTLNALDISATWYKPTWAIVGALANVTGSTDPLLYANSITGQPDGTSVSLEVNYSPFMDGTPSAFTSTNFKIGAKYVHFIEVNGGSTNFDGAGHNASGNGFVLLYGVLAF